jgi:5-(carboxyamino)imidazole ribonucleotide synthase
MANMGPLGILGGGQLGRMTLRAASTLGIDVVIAERFANSPAARLTSQRVVFKQGWDDSQALDRLARLAAVVTLENEFVDWRILQALARAELPVPLFGEVADPAGLIAVAQELGWPVMLKARRDGYDGRGNIVVRDASQVGAAFSSLGWPARALFAEAYVEFERELATLVVRGQDGQVAQYPVVETHQDSTLHICREVLAPADLPRDIAAHAAAIARGAVEAVGGVGAFGVELFLLADRQVCINELAPRPHNSAHYTIEACWSSQFDSHVRAVLGLPLGDPGLRAPAAAMVNLLGTRHRPMLDQDLLAALTEPHAFVHLYGKAENRPGRKMGHVTALGPTPDAALAIARSTVSRIGL